MIGTKSISKQIFLNGRRYFILFFNSKYAFHPTYGTSYPRIWTFNVDIIGFSANVITPLTVDFTGI